MISHLMRLMNSPMKDINVNLGVDKPLWQYVQKAVQDIEIINMLKLYPVSDENVNGDSEPDPNEVYPFIHVINWDWNPHPSAIEIQDRRRETGDKLNTKYIGDTRIGILKFDIYCGARDKNKILEEHVIPNKLYIPIEDDHGRYMYEGLRYLEYQLVDKLLYPSGKDSITIKSLLPIAIQDIDHEEVSIDGYHLVSKIGMVKIFNTMEPIITCFMHLRNPLNYLGCFPALQFCDKVGNDTDEFHYFHPVEDIDLYVKAHKRSIERVPYFGVILGMCCELIRKYKPDSYNKMMSSQWWIYQLSYYDNAYEHRGACHEMHVGRMLDTISAWVLPTPLNDKRTMTELLKFILQTEFKDINIFSYENKRLRLNEVISTIVTAEVSSKLRKMFSYGKQIDIKNLMQQLKFTPRMILKKMHQLGTVNPIDFANDLDYPQQLKLTKKGPNSLGRMDNHKISHAHRQLHPSAMGKIDLYDSSKDVGQTGMISPWGNMDDLINSNPYQYDTIKYDAVKCLEEEFPNEFAVTTLATDAVDLNKCLDKLTMHATMNLVYQPNIERITEKK